MIKTQIPARPRNKKIVPTGGSSIAPIVSSGGSSHTHNNKSLLDLINQGNIDVLSKLFVDESDNLYTTQNFYSQQEISAYGIGSGGSGGGGDISKLPSWAGYTPAMVDYYVSAGLLVPFYNDMQSRVGAIEAGGGGGGSTVTWGTESGGYVPLTVEGVSKSVALSTHTHSQYALTTHNHSGVYEPAFTKNQAFNKDFGTTSTTVARGNHTHSGVYEPVFSKNTAFNKNFGTTSGTVAEGNHTHSQYALTTHNHSGVYEPVFTKNTAFNKNFGTTSGTVVEGNDSRIVNGQTAYGWGDHSSAGYALNTALTAHINKVDNPHAVTTVQIGAVDLTTNQTIGGVKAFTDNVVIKGAASNSPLKVRAIDGYRDFTGLLDNLYLNYVSDKDILMVMGGGNVGIGTTSPAYKLDVSGAGRFTGNVTAPTFIGALSGNASTATKLSSNRTYALTGDVAGSVSNDLASGFSIATTLANSGVTAGTYKSVTVDAKGRVTAGTNPTTVSGYGITDAVTLNTAQTITGAKTFSANITASISVTTPKVIFAAAGWSLEQTGTELQMKYNGAAKMRFLSGGSIVATQEITAYS